jgi:hypothetical protein
MKLPLWANAHRATRAIRPQVRECTELLFGIHASRSVAVSISRLTASRRRLRLRVDECWAKADAQKLTLRKVKSGHPAYQGAIVDDHQLPTENLAGLIAGSSTDRDRAHGSRCPEIAVACGLPLNEVLDARDRIHALGPFLTGGAVNGSSGQECFGYLRFSSLRTSSYVLAQKLARSSVTC